MTTPIHVFDGLPPELRALANEYGLEKVTGAMTFFKTSDPVQLEARLKYERAYVQTKTAEENKNIGIQVREAMKK